MNRNYLIAGIAVIVVIVLLATGIWWLVRSTEHPAFAGQKVFVDQLGYCGAEDIRPCIESFSQTEDGNMLVSILVPASTFPDFYLTISTEGEEFRYDCEKVEDVPTEVECIGREMFPGALLQFTLVSIEDERVLAEGQFAIIGLLLSTQVAGAFESTSPGETLTPVPTFTPASYPNPSYPKP